MTFAHTEMLFMLWAVPLLVLAYAYGRRKRKGVLRAFADRRALPLLVPQGLTARRRLRAALIVIAALLLVGAMVGPRYGFQWQETQRRGVDLIIALDCSRSMLAADIQPTRLERAKREIIDLLAMLQGDRVGLVAFSGSAFLQCPLTIDYAAFDLFLSVLTPDYLPLGGTDLNAAVRTALSGFAPDSPADKAIILITDGEQTGRGDPEEAASAAQAAGVKLFCIGVGTSQGGPVPTHEGFKKDAGGQIVLTRLDESLLTRMAVTTGGSYVRSVAGDMDLEAIYRDQIRGGMQTATLEAGRKKVWADRYQWPLAMAILLLIAAQAIAPAHKTLLSLVLALAVLASAAPSQASSLRKGYEAYRQERYAEALEQFVAGQIEDPDNPEVLYNLGNAYYKNGDYAAAEAHYSQALSRASEDLKARILYNLGNTAFRQDALNEAVRNYQAALQLAPNDLQARENLAFVEKRLQEQQQQSSPSGASGQASESKEPPASQPPAQTQDETPPEAQRQGSPQESEHPKKSEPAGDPGTDGAQQEEPAKRSQPAEGRNGTATQAQPMADQLLDRLKDEPGRAMMPAYGRQPVDKDW
ncbi:MAG: hypothetical protein VR64_17650 [Desulfatitalea sp. BRH_c12]|nr:MAG: hypothetical protein VR64_17650 [Desulfatitalea sp. BRH_c12]